MRADNARSSPAAPGQDGQPDDATIIGLWLSDPEKFAVLFRRHAPAIQRYVIRRIGQEQSDDVVAETLSTGARSPASRQEFRPASRPARWCTATSR